MMRSKHACDTGCVLAAVATQAPVIRTLRQNHDRASSEPPADLRLSCLQHGAGPDARARGRIPIHRQGARRFPSSR